MTPEERQAAARSIWLVAAEHKASCDDPECRVNLMSLGLAFQEIKGRDLMQDEWRRFM